METPKQVSLRFPNVSRVIWSVSDLQSMGRLRDFFHWAVGEFTRAETTLLFVHVAATRLHALTLPRSIRNESVATLSQNTGPGL